MSLRGLRSAFLGLLGCIFFAHEASADFVISPFNADQQVLVSGTPAGPKTSFNHAVAATSIGGFRTIVLNRLGPANTRATLTADSNVTQSGFFTFSSPAGVTGSAELQFDGNDNSVAIDPNGLGGVDITEGGLDTGFLFRMVADMAAPLTITAYSGAGNVSTASVLFPVNGTFTPVLVYVPFTAFGVVSGSGADFASIGALSFLIDGSNSPSLDAQIDFITTVRSVPEPGSLALGMIGAGASVLLVRRKRAKVATS